MPTRPETDKIARHPRENYEIDEEHCAVLQPQPEVACRLSRGREPCGLPSQTMRGNQAHYPGKGIRRNHRPKEFTETLHHTTSQFAGLCLAARLLAIAFIWNPVCCQTVVLDTSLRLEFIS